MTRCKHCDDPIEQSQLGQLPHVWRHVATGNHMCPNSVEHGAEPPRPGDDETVDDSMERE